MKKTLSILAIMLIATTASAQAPFTVYTPSQSYDNSSNYYGGSVAPFTIYEPAPSRYYTPAPRQQSKTYNLTGYYRSGDNWYSMPIKVTVTGDRVVLSAYKNGNFWTGNSGAVSEVGYYDPEVAKEHFNYKAPTLKGTVYF